MPALLSVFPSTCGGRAFQYKEDVKVNRKQWINQKAQISRVELLLILSCMPPIGTLAALIVFLLVLLKDDYQDKPWQPEWWD